MSNNLNKSNIKSVFKIEEEEKMNHFIDRRGEICPLHLTLPNYLGAVGSPGTDSKF